VTEVSALKVFWVHQFINWDRTWSEQYSKVKAYFCDEHYLYMF
jgi:hypothetical protein